MNETGLALPSNTNTFWLAPATELAVVLATYQMKADFIKSVLKEGTDYGKIPGAGDKPALFKPGAEKMMTFFSLAPVFEDVQTLEDWTGDTHAGEPFFYYRQRCKLYNGPRLVATADGSCNSWEKKYRYRAGERKCPACGKPTIIKGKEEFGGGWICFAKKGGCGSKFKAGDKAIEGQETGQVKNPDVAEQVNTILKMAQKRALVAATLIATNVSDYFTQDVEDYSYASADVVDAVFSSVDHTPAPAPVTPPTNGKARADEIVREIAPKDDHDQQYTPAPETTTTAAPADAPLVYKEPTAKIGKHQYPAPWAKMLAAYQRVNAYEVDGILQILRLAGDTKPEAVVAAINKYLDEKGK